MKQNKFWKLYDQQLDMYLKEVLVVDKLYKGALLTTGSKVFRIMDLDYKGGRASVKPARRRIPGTKVIYGL